MGCCLTTAATVDDLKTNSKGRDALPPSALPFEEETVKEVLSETPVTSKKPSPFNSIPTKNTARSHQIPHLEQAFRPPKAVVHFTKNPLEENGSEVSSEMYTTYSASFSAATTTTFGTGTIDEDGEVTQKVKKLPSAKMVSRRQPATQSGEHVKRKERGSRHPPLPPPRRSAVPSTDKKPQLPSRNIPTNQRHRNVAPSGIVRREPLARRSRSPASWGVVGQVAKVKERSPVRKSSNRVPLSVTENKGNVKLKKINDRGVVPEPEPEPDTGESLENPRVSLECFIFL